MTSEAVPGGAAGAGDPAAIVAGFEQAGANAMVLEGPDLIVRAVNRRVHATLGDRPWLGRPFAEVAGDLLGQQWFELLREVHDTGRTITGEGWRTHITRPDGVSVAITIDHVLTPWLDEDGEVKGVVALSIEVSGASSDEHDAEVAALAAEVREARRVVTALQRALLPADLPALPGLEVAARYLLAAGDQGAGGDWYDVVAQPGGRVALVVGDVVGRGVTASATMGQLRALAVDRLEVGAGPGEVMATLDRYAGRRPAARSATVCVAVLDPVTGALEYCTAGHPPPLVVPTGAGEGRYLAPSGGGPLATAAAFPTRADVLGPDEVLLLYTDGIVERPNRAAARSTLELRQVATVVARNEALSIGASSVTADRVCEQVLELLTRATGHRDDITLLAARRVPRLAAFHLRLVADATTVWRARAPLADWLSGAHPGPEDVPVAKAVVTELVQNAVDHAYGGPVAAPAAAGPADRPVDIDAWVEDDGTLVLSVTDQGRWRPADPNRPGRGLGLTFVEQLVDDLDVARSDAGTAVTVRVGLRRPAGLQADDAGTGAGPTGPRPEADTYGVAFEPGPPARLAVRGAVDATSAPDLHYELARRALTGTELVADLGDVTLLASAGVHALARALDEARSRHARLRIVAASGSAAHHVLTLSSLPLDSDPPAASA
jgi:serine phosphatase RsbU (regulator of sigma subunit)/anti-sigma regulatory factor (Ser/Thr protein kinase)/anti-anti-sigma regulatory factor